MMALAGPSVADTIVELVKKSLPIVPFGGIAVWIEVNVLSNAARKTGGWFVPDDIACW